MRTITTNALILAAAFVAVASVAVTAGQKVKEGAEVPKMEDLAIELGERPDALADLGEALGRGGISMEGGGVWGGEAHLLFEDGAGAQRSAEGAGFRVLAIREVLMLQLKQDEPGQLGKLSRRMAESGVKIQVMYSDHNHHLILVVNDMAKGRAVSQAWMRERHP